MAVTGSVNAVGGSGNVGFGNTDSTGNIVGNLGGPPRPQGGELIMAAGFGGILVSAMSVFAQLLDLPSLSEASVAAFGVALVLVGALKRRQFRSTRPQVADVEVAAEPFLTVDLPSLTGQISGVLAELRRQYGMAYRSRTWIEKMLPAYGADFDDPALARDLLAAAALDAGGIRADVAGLAESHSQEQIAATGCTILAALQNVLAACEVPTDLLPTPHPSDPTSWPASRC